MNLRHCLTLLILCAAAVLGGCSTMNFGAAPRVGMDLPPTQPPAPPTPGTIYQSGNSVAFLEDPKAHRVGDVLTVVLQEKTQAQAASSTSTGKKDSIDVGVPTVFGHSISNLNAAANANNTFAGSGNSAQSNQLTGQITVRVMAILPDGILKIAGGKQLQINQSDEMLTLTGLVRQQDIGPDNTVPSGRVAMAEIHYHGRGALGDANQMGWLARFFNSPLWPF